MYFCACAALHVTGSKGRHMSVRYSYTRRRSTAALHSAEPSGQTRFAMATCLPRHLILTIIDVVRIMEPIMSTEATLTSKGQTTIPKPIRDSLGMKPGDRMSFTLMPDGVVIMRVKNKRVSELAGLLHKKGRKPLPIELLSR